MSSQTPRDPLPPTPWKNGTLACLIGRGCSHLTDMAIIHISILSQELTLVDSDGTVLFRASISSGAAGTGFEEGSGRTPTGRFTICSKHGENAPLNALFRARIPVGTWPCPDAPQDAILARILCLEGLDRANANTRARYIYIHGTSDIAHLGTPASHGCIRLSPNDIATLYPLVPLGTTVIIA